MIQRGSGVAVWWQIVQTLEKEISDQLYKPGARLPSEAELAERFGVNRHTIRRAVGELEKHGLVRIEQGRGIFLQDYAVRYSVGRRTRFSENLRRQQLAGGMKVAGSEALAAPAAIAKALGVRTGTALLKVDTVGEVDGAPINFSSHYFVAKRFAGIAEAIADAGSITLALQGFGVADYERTESRITAHLPDDVTARMLQQPRTQPVLQVEGVNVDQEGKPVEYCISRFAGDAVQLVVND